MSVATYTELCDEVRAWMNRPRLASSDIDRGIRLTESIIKQRLRSQVNRTSAAVLVGGTNGGVFPIPSDYLELIQMVPTGTWDDTGVTTPVLEPPIEIVSFQLFSFVDAAMAGAPRYAAEVPDGSAWRVWPGSSQYEVTAWYFRRPSPLTSTVPTNFLLTNEPDLYLSGTIAMLEEFFKVPAKSRGQWGSLFDSFFTSGQRNLSRSQVAGSTLRVRSPYGNQ